MKMDWSPPELMRRTRTQFIRNRGLRSLLKEITCLQGGERILDVGCGIGTMAQIFYRIYGASVEIYGVDSNESYIEFARTRWGRPRNVYLEHGDVARLGFQDSFFDLVVSFGLLEWLQDPLPAVDEMIRVSKPGGQLLTLVLEMSRYEKLPKNEKMDEYYQDYLRGIATLGPPIRDEGRHIKEILERCGIVVKDHQYVFESRIPITEGNLRIWERSSATVGNMLFSGEMADFYFQFLKAAGWSRERFDKVLKEENSPERRITFLREHLGEEIVQRLPTAILEGIVDA